MEDVVRILLFNEPEYPEFVGVCVSMPNRTGLIKNRYWYQLIEHYTPDISFCQFHTGEIKRNG